MHEFVIAPNLLEIIKEAFRYRGAPIKRDPLLIGRENESNSVTL
jgi:hypothetical protein